MPWLGKAASHAATRRGGKTVAIGLPHPSKQLTIPAVSLIAEERQLLGCYMGSCVPQRDIPRFINLYRAGLLPVELLKSREIQLDHLLDRRNVIRGYVERLFERFSGFDLFMLLQTDQAHMQWKLRIARDKLGQSRVNSDGIIKRALSIGNVGEMN